MKFLNLFLTFYFMVLSFVPCSDVYVQSSKNVKETYSIQQKSDNLHSEEHKEDLCSPLCSCNCCQITVASFKSEPLPLQKKVTEYFSKKIHFQKNDFAYLVYDQIWQPPKI